MLTDPACPLRTINHGCSIPTDLSYFEASHRCQSVKLFGEPTADKTADQRNHEKLCGQFTYVLQKEGYSDLTDVVWSVVFIVDEKIGGTGVFNMAYLKAFKETKVILILSQVQRPSMR